ncbi:winged helix-turn-helix transcriptional regulator [Evtepia sp.]|uniref:winged helix-turn-helix transcriptional regulator n=1 Tax=Evtepia sp. TaxID=2773933 RepID=UPI003FA5913F
MASTLKLLITNGLVKRKSYDEIPPRVEYSLTEKGQSVVPILQSICQWAGVFYKDTGEHAVLFRFIIHTKWKLSISPLR